MRPHVRSFLILLLILHEGYRPASLISLALQIHHDVLLGDQQYTHTHTQNATRRLNVTERYCGDGLVLGAGRDGRIYLYIYMQHPVLRKVRRRFIAFLRM